MYQLYLLVPAATIQAATEPAHQEVAVRYSSYRKPKNFGQIYDLIVHVYIKCILNTLFDKITNIVLQNLYQYYSSGIMCILEMCVYKGKAYTQGQTWDDGCQFRCTCVDQNRGQYRCTER